MLHLRSHPAWLPFISDVRTIGIYRSTPSNELIIPHTLAGDAFMTADSDTINFFPPVYEFLFCHDQTFLISIKKILQMLQK